MINLIFIHKILKRDFKGIFILFLIFLITPAAWAAGPYYIKNGGNDNAAGTSDDTAWATLANVDNAHFSNGTDIYFKQGDTWTITSPININHSGVDRNNRATIGCYEDTGDFECNGSRPIIQNSTEDGFVFWFQGSEYLTFNYLDIRSSHANWQNSNSTGLYSGSDGSGGNIGYGYLHVTNCKFYHLGHYSMHLAQMGDYNVITGNIFEEVGNAIYFIDEVNAGSNYNYIAQNTCTDIVGYYSKNQRIVIDGHCVGLQRTSYSIVENNNSKNAWRGAYGIFVGNPNYASVHNIVRYNTSYGTRGAGMNFYGGGDADSYANLYYGNILTNTGQGVDREAIKFAEVVCDSKGNRIFNNTIYNAGTVALGVAKDTDYTYWKNNIVHTNDLNSLLFRFQTDGGGGHNLIIDNNLYWTAKGSPITHQLWEDTNDGVYNWDQWKAKRGNDTKSIIPADPQFGDPSNYDFSLSSTSSPAHEAGGYLSYVLSTSGTLITVADSYWFHGDFGLLDADDNPITGMEITFYDHTHGLQYRIITSDFINHGTPGTFVVDRSIKSIYNASHLHDPAYTTQVSLRFFGTKPDIGAKEYQTFLKIKQPISFPFSFRIVEKNDQ